MAVIDDLAAQTLTAGDAAHALPLSAEAGWNQTADDWRFMLDHGSGHGVRETGGRLIGSALALPLGDALAWIGMVLVARDRRRNGIGTRLLHRCIDDVRGRGAVAGLDATEFGRPVYLPLGFRDLYPISRWRLAASAAPSAASAVNEIRPAGTQDLPAIVAFDAARTGMSRTAILHYLFEAAPRHAFVAIRNGEIEGYALGRPGRIAHQIGPVVADQAADAVALMAMAADREVLLDAPDAHDGIADWLHRRGAVRERGFVRMVLGDADARLASPGAVYALAGPELG